MQEWLLILAKEVIEDKVRSLQSTEYSPQASREILEMAIRYRCDPYFIPQDEYPALEKWILDNVSNSRYKVLNARLRQMRRRAGNGALPRRLRKEIRGSVRDKPN